MPESVTPERQGKRNAGGLNAADAVSHLLRRLNFVGRPHPVGTQKSEVFRADEGVKASRIHIYSYRSASMGFSEAAFLAG